MSMSLGRYHPELVGPDATTADGTALPGITTIPVPILTADGERIAEIFAQADRLDLTVPFTEAALTTKTYADYEAKLAETTADALHIHGLLLFGAKKAINKLVGQLPLLR